MKLFEIIRNKNYVKKATIVFGIKLFNNWIFSWERETETEKNE